MQYQVISPSGQWNTKGWVYYMSKKDNLLAIDYVKSASVGGSSRVVGSGSGGTVDTSGFCYLMVQGQ